MKLIEPSLIALYEWPEAVQSQLASGLSVPIQTKKGEELMAALQKAAKANETAVFDATGLQPQQWQKIRRIAKTHPIRLEVLAFEPDNRTKSYLRQLGLRKVQAVTTNSQIDWRRPPSWQVEEKPPFDIIGDVHGCIHELRELLKRLGYRIRKDKQQYIGEHPEGRRIIFVGDLVDRGPNSAEVLRLVMDLWDAGLALAVPGNHDDKLMRRLMGRKTNLRHGLAETLEELERQKDAEAFKIRILTFLKSLPDHLILDEGRLVVAHAGLKEAFHGRTNGVVRAYCLYGEVTGSVDEEGLPIRRNWAGVYEGDAYVLYGHSPVVEARWQNKTMDLDTGCCFGGKLTALRYPELTLESVQAQQQYSEPVRPLTEWPNVPLPKDY